VKFTSGFYRALASRLAYELTMPITGKQQLQEQMWKMYQADLVRARATDLEAQGFEQWAEPKELSQDIPSPLRDWR
jgi:hypothetical protein